MFSDMRNILFCLFTFSIVSGAYAAPTVDISAAASPDGSSVIISFMQDDLASVASCHYNVFVSHRKNALNVLPGKGISVATFKRDVPLEQIIAKPLRSIRKAKSGPFKKKNVTFYIRTLVSCEEGENGYSQLISFSVPTMKYGKIKSARRFEIDMKYHMQYYHP